MPREQVPWGLVGLTFAFVVLGVAARKRPKSPKKAPLPEKPRPPEPLPEVSGMAHEIPIEDPDDPPPDITEIDPRLPCFTLEGGETQGGGACIPPWDLAPEERTSAPFADIGDETPFWPVRTSKPDMIRVPYWDVRKKWHGHWGRHFGSARAGDDGEKRYHAGVDLEARPGDVIVAAKPGTVIAHLPFHHGTWAVYIRQDEDGQIVNYGEVERNSWVEFGFQQVLEGETETVHVEAGDPLARAGVQSGGNTMLHLEIYDPAVTVSDIRAQALRWPHGESAPDGLLDPTAYLVSAQLGFFQPSLT